MSRAVAFLGVVLSFRPGGGPIFLILAAILAADAGVLYAYVGPFMGEAMLVLAALCYVIAVLASPRSGA